ncbi:MAG TPA: DUF4253 domain-containing protein [Chloroflexia bacterium]|nr:DUF4253 domain-containing protein [Chloroflexia bacterium]
MSVEELAEVLGGHGIGTSSLELLFSPDGHEVYGLAVPGERALTTWGELRDLSEQTGYWPVILGAEEEVEFHRRFIEDFGAGTSVREILSKAEATDVDRLLENRLLGLAELDSDEWEAFSEMLMSKAEEAGEGSHIDVVSEWAEHIDKVPGRRRAVLEQLLREKAGEWPENAEPHNYFSIPYEWTDGYKRFKPLRTVRVALVPTRASWEVPAYLKFGAWNDCPQPEEHVAILKRWHAQYGAQVVGLTHDVLEVGVTRPPNSKLSAFNLAREQYGYCSDLVDQGDGGILDLAATLLDASVWYFWWD